MTNLLTYPRPVLVGDGSKSTSQQLRKFVAHFNSRERKHRLGQYLREETQEAHKNLDLSRVSHEVVRLTFRRSEDAVYLEYVSLPTPAGQELSQELTDSSCVVTLTTVTSGDGQGGRNIVRFDFKMQHRKN